MSDLMFGTVSEELGLFIAFIIALAIAFIAFFSRAASIHSRSTFYSISSCAAAGMLVFQCCLNIFGTTDIFPLTGVTLPFVSLGGSSMISVWGLLAIVKSSDEYTYAAQRK
jgi:cell division protein FtsW (lipid II flippase)